MPKKETINVKGTEIILLSHKKDDYISLTDMAKFKNAEATGLVIAHWLSTRYTVDFLGIWERMNNPNFNVTEFGNIRNETGTNDFILSSKQWIEKTGAIGIIAKPGRYDGGNFANKYIAYTYARRTISATQQCCNYANTVIEYQRQTQRNRQKVSVKNLNDRRWHL